MFEEFLTTISLVEEIVRDSYWPITLNASTNQSTSIMTQYMSMKDRIIIHNLIKWTKSRLALSIFCLWFYGLETWTVNSLGTFRLLFFFQYESKGKPDICTCVTFNVMMYIPFNRSIFNTSFSDWKTGNVIPSGALAFSTLLIYRASWLPLITSCRHKPPGVV